MDNEQEILEQAITTFKEKKREYGDNVDKATTGMLLTLFPDGISANQFDEALFLIRISEKLGRLVSQNIDAKAKSDAYGDIVGYGLLGLKKDQEDKDKKASGG